MKSSMKEVLIVALFVIAFSMLTGYFSKASAQETVITIEGEGGTTEIYCEEVEGSTYCYS